MQQEEGEEGEEWRSGRRRELKNITNQKKLEGVAPLQYICKISQCNTDQVGRDFRNTIQDLSFPLERLSLKNAIF